MNSVSVFRWTLCSFIRRKLDNVIKSRVSSTLQMDWIKACPVFLKNASEDMRGNFPALVCTKRTRSVHFLFFVTVLSSFTRAPWTLSHCLQWHWGSSLHEKPNFRQTHKDVKQNCLSRDLLVSPQRQVRFFTVVSNRLPLLFSHKRQLHKLSHGFPELAHGHLFPVHDSVVSAFSTATFLRWCRGDLN